MIRVFVIVFMSLLCPFVSKADEPEILSKDADLATSEPAVELSFEEKHKDSQFVFLYQSYEVKVNEDWSYVMHTHRSAKILKEEAKNMGEIPLYYQEGVDKIYGIKAFTLTPDGKKHRYTKIQDMKVNPSDQMYTDSKVKIITLPEVNVGSVLDHEYTTFSKNLPMKNTFWQVMDFSSSEPTQELRYSITFPKKLGIQYKAFGLTKEPEITETATQITYSWVVEEIDKSESQEDYLPPPTPESFKETVEFSSISKWSDVADWYWSLVKKNLIITPEMTQLVQGLVEGKSSIKAKTNAIKEYVQDNFRYVSMSFGNNLMEPHPTDQVFKNKYGDCKDLSLLTVALLKIAGVEAHVALFNNEYSIIDPKLDLPAPATFDHLVVLVKDAKEGDFYIDPILKEYELGQFPINYQGAYTLVITEDGGKLDKLPLFDEQRMYSMRNMDVTIYPDGTSIRKTDSLSGLDESISARQTLKALDQEAKEKFYDSLLNSVAGNGSVVQWLIDGVDQKYGPLTYHSIVKRKDDYPITDDIMIINPGDLYERDSDFTANERKKPIFYAGNSLAKITNTYHLPEGFEVLSIPKNVELDIGFFTLKRIYTHKGNEIKMEETVRYKRMQLPKEDYAKVKDFFDKLPGKTNQRIILRKKT